MGEWDKVYRKYENSKKGNALILVIILMAVLTILGAALMSLSFAESKLSYKETNKLKAHYIAQAGADALAKCIEDDPSKAVNGFQINSNNYNGGTFNANVTVDASNNVKIKSEGTTGGTFSAADTVYLEMKMQTSTVTSEVDADTTGLFDNVVYSVSDINLVGNNKGSTSGPLQSAGAITTYLPYIDPVRQYTPKILPKVKIPDLPNATSIDTNGTVHKDVEMQCDHITINPQGTLAFKPPANGILRIVTNTMTCQGTISVEPNGGKVYLFVKDTLTMQTKHSVGSNSLVIFLGDEEHGKNGSLDFKGNGNFTGYIYGPNASVNLGNPFSNINGAIICNTFDLSKFASIQYGGPLPSTYDFHNVLTTTQSATQVTGFKRSGYSSN